MTNSIAFKYPNELMASTKEGKSVLITCQNGTISRHIRICGSRVHDRGPERMDHL